jgi:hypothetical protein
VKIFQLLLANTTFALGLFNTGANPSISVFTATTPALYAAVESVFTQEKNNFFSKSALSLKLRCKS